MRIDVGDGVRLFVDIDGVEYEVDGDRMVRRPTVVLLHGGPGMDHSPFKNELNAAVDQMMAPPSEEEQARQDFIQQMELVSIQAGVEEQQLKNNKLQTDALLNLAKISEIQADTEIEGIKVSVEVRRLAKEFEELRELGRQNDAAMMNAAAALRKAANETERDRRGGTEQGGTG